MRSTSKSCHVLRAVVFAWLLGTAGANAAGDTQSLDAVRAAAEAHVRAQRTKVIATAGALDTRLRLALCAGTLDTFSPAGSSTQSGRTTVGVRCADGAAWTIYVPVLVESEIPVLLLKRSVARGARLSADDVEVQTRRVTGSANAYLNTVAELQKQTLKRPLAAGTRAHR